MTNSAKSDIIKCLDPSVECYYAPLKNKKNVCYKYYRSFSLNDEIYAIQNFALSKNSDHLEVVNILCVFTNQEREIQLIVRKYHFATHLKDDLKETDLTKFGNNEVVEDSRKDYKIRPDQILRKCNLVFADQDDSPHTIEENNLDSLHYFLCRYTLKSNGFFPILSTPQTILNEINYIVASPSPVRAKEQTKRKLLGSENTPIDDFVVEECGSEARSNKMRSPKNEHKNHSTTLHDTGICSPIQRNLVKRNLNESFDNLPSVKDTSILNYSIVSNEDIENPHVLKLRISNKNKIPLVVLKKIDDDIYSIAKQIEEVEVSPVRASSRIIRSKVYPDYISPTKCTPKREISCLGSKSVDKCLPTTTTKSRGQSRKTQQQLRTPTKIVTNVENSVLARRKINTPKRYQESPESTASKSNLSTPKGIRKSKRQTGISPTKRTNRMIYGTPEKESGTSPITPRNRRTRTKLTCSGSKTVSIAKELPSKIQKHVQTPKTPKNRAKLIKDGVITPSMQSRSKTVELDGTPLMMARSQLHVSYVPAALTCREKEYCDIINFVEGKLQDGFGGCMYISGVPGTGKTATVTSVINKLLQKGVPKFSFVNVNGMRLTEPRQSYVEICKQLTGKILPWEQAQSMLEEKFSKSHNQLPVVMLIDELDILCTKRQDVVYNLLDLPSKAKNQLIVITIANTMDLPERLLMSRVSSRLGLTRLTFQAYTHKQLQEIVTKRISGNESFNSDAIQFVARKVASVSGDARRALDICRRAVEIAESEGKRQEVTMNHVNEALNAMITQPKVRAIKNCSRLEKLILQSIVAEVERTGVEETTFSDVFKMLISCAAIEGFQMVSSTNALSAVSRLSSCRLLLSDPKCNDITQKLILNVSVDDVYYALKRV